MAPSGDSNMYLIWRLNKTGDWEISFSASIEGGKTFVHKISFSVLLLDTIQDRRKNQHIIQLFYSLYIFIYILFVYVPRDATLFQTIPLLQDFECH
jgi:hypothetical protein